MQSRRRSLFSLAAYLPVVFCFCFYGGLKADADSLRELPAGQERELLQAICTRCHSVERIERSAGLDTPAQWRQLIASMIDIAEPQAQTLAAYLAQNLPADPDRKPTLVPGNEQITIKEWVTPTLGQRARDPIEAPDGSIWWTGMNASLVGRLDPVTGDMQEFFLPPASRPHSILPDKDGSIWYTGNSNATIGRIDPDTGLIREYSTQAADPHTAVFHPNGNLYFTAQRAGVLGRLDPKTGDIDEVATRRRPYGIKVGPEGRLWIAFNGTNAIAALDSDTMALEYFDVPDERTRIRRLDIDSTGRIWYVNSSLGRIGVLDPVTGKTREWPSPSGPDSHPYAIAVIDDIVWYNESGMRPDALVRFDPSEERFQSWAIPSGVGIIRHVWVTKSGDLLIHQSASNRIGVVQIPKAGK